MRYLTLSVLLVLSAALLVGPAVPLRVPSTQGEMVVKHKWDVIPDNWLSLGPPPDDSTIELHIALQPSQKNALIDVLYEVSQPGYGAHLSRKQLAELVAPRPDTLILVTTWLEHNGVSPSSISMTHGGGWLTVTDVPVPQANVLLGASYELYYHAGRNATILRTVGYSLPLGLHKHVQTIVPTTAFTSMRLLQQTPRHRSGGAAAPNAASGEPVNTLSGRQRPNIISELRSMYGTETFNPVGRNNRLGIVGYDNEYPDLTDQSTFMSLFRAEVHDQTVSFETIDKDLPEGPVGPRANMFAQYAAALTYPIPITFYKGTGAPLLPHMTNNPGPGDGMQQWLKWALNEQQLERNPPTVGLIMGGTREQYLPLEYAMPVCDLFAALGVLGTTILVASGDSGVGHDKFKKFYVNFPASCPFVTSVGGTTRKESDPQSEIASFFSGGGFSTYFEIKPYQIDKVKPYLDYLTKNKMYPELYQAGGRGVPDIAGQSSYCVYIYGRQLNDMDSTVCGTSIAAAIFSILNDFRISEGMGTLGWVNPWLYGTGWRGFTDIKEGNNPGCKTRGFFATEGWDPVTGLGTPNFEILQSILGPPFRPPQAPQPARRNQSFHDES